MKKQETLIDLDSIPKVKNNKGTWFKKFEKYCWDKYEKEGDKTGCYCCGYHWCCNECFCSSQSGCADCVLTIKTILLNNGIEIDYNDYDFEKWENLAYEAWKKGKGIL